MEEGTKLFFMVGSRRHSGLEFQGVEFVVAGVGPAGRGEYPLAPEDSLGGAPVVFQRVEVDLLIKTG